MRFEHLEQRWLFAIDVNFNIDALSNVHNISRFIYGVNQPLSGAYANNTLTRIGGNRWTAYNWENNASNAGSDYLFQNDNYLGGGNTPGGAVAPTLADAANHNAGALITIPMALRVIRGLGANYDSPYALMGDMGTNIKLHAFTGMLLIVGYVIAIVAGHIWHPPPFFLR